MHLAHRDYLWHCPAQDVSLIRCFYLSKRTKVLAYAKNKRRESADLLPGGSVNVLKSYAVSRGFLAVIHKLGDESQSASVRVLRHESKQCKIDPMDAVLNYWSLQPVLAYHQKSCLISCLVHLQDHQRCSSSWHENQSRRFDKLLLQPQIPCLQSTQRHTATN